MANVEVDGDQPAAQSQPLPAGVQAQDVWEDSEDEMCPPPSTWNGYASDLYQSLSPITKDHLECQNNLSQGHLQFYMLLEKLSATGPEVPCLNGPNLLQIAQKFLTPSATSSSTWATPYEHVE